VVGTAVETSAAAPATSTSAASATVRSFRRNIVFNTPWESSETATGTVPAASEASGSVEATSGSASAAVRPASSAALDASGCAFRGA
jgi:hypothetical protein